MDSKPATPLLTVQGLTLTKAGRQLLAPVSLQVMPGEVVALLGPNGAGKSTLLKLLAGDFPASGGQACLHGQKLTLWPRLPLARQLGVLPQHSTLNFPFSVREVVRLGSYPLTLSRNALSAAVAHWLARLEITHLAEALYPQLSGGERQRVQLARVLLQLSQAERPPLLLLDEPTAALDLGQQHRLLALVRELAAQQQMAVLMVLHDLNQAAHYADRLLLLKDGRLLDDGPPQQVLRLEQVEAIWHYRPVVSQLPGLRLLF